MFSFLLNPEWLIPLATGLGLAIAKIWFIFKKTSTVQIDKITAIGGIETDIREDLMERLKQTEDRLDKLMETTAALTIKVSVQSEKIIHMDQLLKKYKLVNRALSTQLQKIVDLARSHTNDCEYEGCNAIMEIIHVSNN